MMNYVGSRILDVSFAEVAKMLTGKKYPDNVHARRMLTTELLKNPNMVSMQDLLSIMSEFAGHTWAAKLWVTCLIQPVLNIMQYSHAEIYKCYKLKLYKCFLLTYLLTESGGDWRLPVASLWKM